MNRTGIEKALRNAVNSAPEIPFEQIAAQPYIRMPEHDYITRQEAVKKVSPVRQLTLATALCLVVILSISGWYIRNKVTDSIITLDVNPSIEIITNQKDEILAVNAMNEDARRIIGDNDYSGTELTDTVPLLLNSLVENSYINQEKNAILLTVTNKNNRKADDLLKIMGNTIKDSLTARNIEPLILSQTLSRKEDSGKLSKKYNISRGKLQLIQDMMAFNPDLTLDTLARLSVEKLLKLANENHMDLSKYLSLDGGAVIPSVTEKPENTSSNTQSGTAKDGKEEETKLEDSNGTENKDTLEENGNEDDQKDQEIEDGHKDSEDKSKEGEKDYSKSGKGKNKDKEDADVKESDKNSDYTDNKEETDNQDEDGSYSAGEGDEDSQAGDEADGSDHEDSYNNQNNSSEDDGDHEASDPESTGDLNEGSNLEDWGDNGQSSNSEGSEDTGNQEHNDENEDN